MLPDSHRHKVLVGAFDPHQHLLRRSHSPTLWLRLFEPSGEWQCLVFWQVDQWFFAHFGRTIIEDALDLLQRLVDGRFVR